jgi:hypothetical protein
MSPSFGRKTMRFLKPPTPGGRQMNLSFETNRLEGLGSLERGKIALVLAQILMQAAGLSVEELDDDER